MIFAFTSRHAQWIEILGRQKVIRVLDAPKGLACTFMSDSMSVGCMNTDLGKVPVIYDEGCEPLPLHPNPSCKTSV